jgi:hypothetical protein
MDLRTLQASELEGAEESGDVPCPEHLGAASETVHSVPGAEEGQDQGGTSNDAWSLEVSSAAIKLDIAKTDQASASTS